MNTKFERNRTDAARRSDVTYDTDHPCSKGHKSRYTSTGTCVICQKQWYEDNREKRLKRMKDYNKEQSLKFKSLLDK